MTSNLRQDDKVVRVFDEAYARKVVDELTSYLRNQDACEISLTSWWGTGLKWARNQAAMTANQSSVWLRVNVNARGKGFQAGSNQLDTESLKGLSSFLNYATDRWRANRPLDREIELLPVNGEGKDVWSAETFNRSIVDTAAAIENLTKVSEEKSLLSAGYIETNGSTGLIFRRDAWGRTEYAWGAVTESQCSVTVRHSKGTASGWAGLSSFDVTRVPADEISTKALEKCIQSFDPVRVEPGRYQTILEPQATGSLLRRFVAALHKLPPEQDGSGVVFLGVDNNVNRLLSKLGLRLIDDRLNVYHEPKHPLYGTHAAPFRRRVDFIKNGILVGLADRLDSHQHEHANLDPILTTSSYVMSGGNTSMEEMISTMNRGLLVTRLEQITVADRASMLLTGVTRDGLWLVEKGKITKAVKNFRWTESPMFAFNNVEQVGIETQVFAPTGSRAPLAGDFASSLQNIVAPVLKVNDFSFTSTIDAI